MCLMASKIALGGREAGVRPGGGGKKVITRKGRSERGKEEKALKINSHILCNYKLMGADDRFGGYFLRGLRNFAPRKWTKSPDKHKMIHTCVQNVEICR